MSGWLGRLKQRNVFRVTAIYAALGYAVMQVSNNLLPALNLPRWILTLLALLYLAGFPLVIGLAWAFEQSATGLRRARPVRGSVPPSPFDYVLVVACVAIFLVAGVQLVQSMKAPRAVVPDGPSAAEASGASTVAVLPFAHFGDEPDDEHFADGLTEELINGLAQIPALRVAGRTSTFYFKGRNEDLREIGRKLGVTHIVEGSVRRSGGRLRITAQLVTASDGFHLWSETFDTTASDAITVQTQISGAVARALHLRLVQPEATSAAARDPQSWQMELVARSRLRTQEPAELMAARDLFAELIAREPENPRARTGFAEATIRLAQDHLALEFDSARAESEEAVETALRLAPQLAEAWRVKGLIARVISIRTGDRSFDAEALQSFRRAVELDPDDSDALAMLASQALSDDRQEEGIALLRRALQIDPLSRLAQQLLGAALAAQGKYAESEQQYASLISLYPNFTSAKVLLGELLIEQGRLDEAARLLNDPQLIREDPLAGLLMANIYANLGMTEQFRRVLADVQTPPAAADMAHGVLLLRQKQWRELRRHADEVYGRTRDPLWLSARLLVAVITDEQAEQRSITADATHALRQDPPVLDNNTSLDALLYATALRRGGQPDQADRIANSLLRRHAASPQEFDEPHSRWVRMAAEASLGNKRQAIAELEAAARQGFRTLVDVDYFMRLEDYPFMAPVVDDPGFRAAIARIEADNERMRQALVANANPL